MKQALVKGQVSFAFSEGKCFCNLDVTWVGIRGVEEVFLFVVFWSRYSLLILKPMLRARF